MSLDRNALARIIAERLRSHRDSLRAQWLNSTPIRYFFQENLLPEDLVRSLAEAFPSPEKLTLRSSLREHKRVGVDIRRYDPSIGECLFAFQHPEVIQAISEITQLKGLEADPTLYASGISVMGKGDFLNPHLDNSHDGDGLRYRVLNLLFYVSPGWNLENGGTLELWNSSVTKAQVILSNFNRLIVMGTDNTNWHSVSKVLVDQPRYCVSNYYFSKNSPLGEKHYTQVTTFTGRPEEPLNRFLLQADALLRNLAGRLLPNYRKKSKHRILPS